MRETTPKVRLIASPRINWDELRDYVDSVGGMRWWDRVSHAVTMDDISDGEVLIEAPGRMCYRSWDVGLNPNVTRVREDSEAYFENLLKSGHGSVLEHANYTFIFEDVSRVFTHELVRHRPGVAISQESMRYVRFDDIPFRIPNALEPVRDDVEEVLDTIEQAYKRIVEKLDIDNMKDMQQKKAITSAIRRILPDGVSTCVTWTSNIRQLRHVIKMRTAPDAEEEMRMVFAQVGKIMLEECPLLFQDFKVTANGAYVPEYVKV